MTVVKKISKMMSGCRLFSTKKRREVMKTVSEDYKLALNIVWEVEDGIQPMTAIAAAMGWMYPDPAQLPTKEWWQ